MQILVILFAFLMISCQQQTDSKVTGDEKDNAEDRLAEIEQFYFAGFHLQPLPVAETETEATEEQGTGAAEEQVEEQAEGMEQGAVSPELATEDTAEPQQLKVVVKMVIKDNKPHSLVVKDISSVADINEPTADEVPADDLVLLFITPSNVDERIGYRGSRRYLSAHGEKVYELHWFDGAWKEYRNRGDSQERGPVSDSSVARFIFRLGEVEYANIDDSFEEVLTSFDGRLALSAEKIAELYFGVTEDSDEYSDIDEHRMHENLSAQCGELLKPYIGYNVYRIERGECQDKDGLLLVRTTIGVTKHLAGLNEDTDIMCIIGDRSIMLSSESSGDSDGKELFSSEATCSDKVVQLQAKEISGVNSVVGFLKIIEQPALVDGEKVEKRIVWLKDNTVSNANAYNEALLDKFREEAPHTPDDEEPTEPAESAEPTEPAESEEGD